VAVGWEALDRWGDDVARIEPLTAGGVNEVWSVRVNGARRRSARQAQRRRSDADLAWETGAAILDREGMAVPVPIPTTDGRDFVDGLVVMSYVEGRPPETVSQWRRADTFRQLHRLTPGWLASGWRSTSCTCAPGRGSTLARCRRRVSLDAEQFGRGSADEAVRRPGDPTPQYP
jgi:hypothetical protein